MQSQYKPGKKVENHLEIYKKSGKCIKFNYLPSLFGNNLITGIVTLCLTAEFHLGKITILRSIDL